MVKAIFLESLIFVKNFPEILFRLSRQKLERPTRKDLRRESPFQMSVSNALIQFLLSSYSQKKRAFGLFFPGKFIIEPVR